METYILLMVIVGFILIMMEPAMPGFFASAIGAFLLVLGIAGMVDPAYLNDPVTIILALLVSAGLVMALLVVYKRYGGSAPPETTVASSLVGKKGMVNVKVIPDSLDGKVEIGNAMWSATSDKEIDVGTRVVVVASEGVHVTVRPVDGPGERSNEDQQN